MHSGQASSQDSMGERQPGSHSSLLSLTSDSLANVLQLLRPADLARLIEMQIVLGDRGACFIGKTYGDRH